MTSMVDVSASVTWYGSSAPVPTVYRFQKLLPCATPFCSALPWIWLYTALKNWLRMSLPLAIVSPARHRVGQG